MIKLKQIIEGFGDLTPIKKKVQDFLEQLKAEYSTQLDDLHFYGTANPDELYLSSIRLKPEFRRQGFGSIIIDKIKKFADENGLVITLSPEPERGYKKKLDQFYKDHGFKYNRGRSKDYRLSSMFGSNMLRQPMREEDEGVDKGELEDLSGKDVILQYLSDHGARPEVVDLAGEEVIIWDKYIIDDSDYPWVHEKTRWMYGSHGQSIINAISDKLEEKRSENFWKYPPTLYHATPKENIPSIQQHGLKMQHKSRSMTNRHISSAVFTTTEPDEVWNPAYSQNWTPGGPYGDALFSIDTKKMKTDGFTPNTSKEPAFAENDATNFLAQKIKAWDGDQDTVSAGDGTSDTTIIIFAAIPPQYLSLVESA